ncbi:MAG: hypothetical protein LBV61_00400 [Burkholderiaceae bacterium]|jgi:hypothetical protein|nr:hypothetical protein [Burkholderiaceae bacterium]
MTDFSLAIVTPSHYGNFCAEYVIGIFDLQEHCRNQGIQTQLLLTTGISVIDHVRNLLVNRFLWKTKMTHMLFVDDDMGFNVEDLAHMFEWRDYDVIGVMSPKKAFDWKRVKDIVLANPDIDPKILPHLAGDYVEMFELADTSRMTVARQPIRVHSIGAGMMMISRRCLMELIEKAKPALIPAASGHPVDYPIYEFFRTSHLDGKPVGEDFYFCSLVNRHGGAIYGCPWIPVTHVGKYAWIGDLPGIARYT